MPDVITFEPQLDRPTALRPIIGQFLQLIKQRAEQSGTLKISVGPDTIEVTSWERAQVADVASSTERASDNVALTDIVRRYVEARFGLHAPEMTTDEFLAATQRSRDLLSAHRSALQEFLVEADLVKFARHVPTRERNERAWSAAEEFISATKPQEVERAAA